MELQSREQFCHDLPQVGSTIFIVDYQGYRLHKTPVEIHVFRDAGEAQDREGIENNTVFHIPEKKYKTGVALFDYHFTASGEFILLVTAKGDDGTQTYTG